MIKIDEKDNLILKTLEGNSKLSTQNISKITKIPITTVHNRIKKLAKNGIIKGYSIIVDHQKIGFNIKAYIMIIVDYKELKENEIKQSNLAKKISKNPLVREVDILAGGADILIKVRTRNVSDLNDFILNVLRNYPGVDKTQTLIVLENILK